MPRRPSRGFTRLPTLTPEIVADDEQLAEVTDEVMLQNVTLCRMSQAIIAAQGRLQDVLGDQWPAYLAVEELINGRMERLCAVLARWAFEEGRRATGRRR